METSSIEDRKFLKEQFMVKGYVLEIEDKEDGMILHTSDMRQLEIELMTVMAEKDICPLRIEVQKPTLENLFMEVVS